MAQWCSKPDLADVLEERLEVGDLHDGPRPEGLERVVEEAALGHVGLAHAVDVVGADARDRQRARPGPGPLMAPQTLSAPSVVPRTSAVFIWASV